MGLAALLLASGFLSLVGAQRAWASDPAIEVEARIDPGSLSISSSARIVVDVVIPEGFHLWSLDPGPGPLALEMRLSGESPIALEGPWHGPEPEVKHDRGFGRNLARYEGPKVRFERLVAPKPAASPGEGQAMLIVRGQICTEEICIGQRHEVRVEFSIAPPGTRVPAGGAAQALGGKPLRERAPAVASTAGFDDPTQRLSTIPTAGITTLEDAKAEGVGAFILLAFFFGLVALATPCVFPAIPLTVSFFSGYSKESFARGARLALTYAVTMVATFTVAGVLVSIFFGVTGLQRFAAHPLFNVALALVLIFFSLNLLGLFEIQVPAPLLTMVNRLEKRYGRAAPASAIAPRSRLADYVVVSIAAITATTVFFTCTVAFVGLVLAAASRGEWFWPTLGMLAFSSSFALPFFLLALFPQMAERMRGKGGGWLSATRVTLGFLELAAATKFLSNADLVWSLHLLSREVVLAFWIPLFAIAGFYLLGKVHFGEDAPSNRSEGRTSVLRVLASSAMFGLSVYLAAGLFNGKPFGGWIDGWLPPLEQPGFTWLRDLRAARERASERGTLLFVNYTGYTCTNCRYMEGAVFPRPEVAEILRKMTLVELFTDGSEPTHEANRADQVKRFGTAALPLYAVERPDGTVVGTFASSTNDAGEFRRFLEASLERAEGRQAFDESQGAPTAMKPENAAPGGELLLKTHRLDDGRPERAIAPGKWTLINFWATWCGPCRDELKDFLVEEGRDLERRGGRFALVAVEDAEGAQAALDLMQSLRVAPSSALRVESELVEGAIDPRLEFDGSLPYTVLIAPTGEIVWRHREKLRAEELRAKMTCFMDESKSDPAKNARKC